MGELKETKSVKQVWVTLVLVVITGLLFGTIVLPRIDAGRRTGGDLEGQAAPDFALSVIHGGDETSRVRLANLSGRPVVLDFWASWCKPCHEQSVILNGLADELEKADVSLVGISTGDRREDATSFAKGKGLRYPSVLDDEGQVASSYGVTSLPTLVVVGVSGKVVAVRRGVVKQPELEQLISRARSG